MSVHVVVGFSRFMAEYVHAVTYPSDASACSVQRFNPG